MLLEYVMKPGLSQIGSACMRLLERMKPGDTERATLWNILVADQYLYCWHQFS